MEGNYFLSTTVLTIEQPLAPFYVFKIKASELVKVCFSMSAYSQHGKLSGVQRRIMDDRINQISLFSKSNSAIFPSSIILSANFDQNGNYIDDENIRWKINDGRLLIPTDQPLASIIDGQHRVEGIKRAIQNNSQFTDFDILCSVFIDMPFSEQAEVFSTINFNQKKVDKSIAYELFGYDLDETNKEQWSPDTLAIYFTRILNNDSSSPLKNRIYTAFDGVKKESDWTISTACMVECISLLMTTDATRDRYYIHQSGFFKSGRSKLKELRVKAPLRELYINGQDKKIFDIIFNYLNKLNELGWFSSKNLVTTKTIGFLAAFEFLRDLINEKGIDGIDYSGLSKIPLKSLEKESFNFSGIGKAQIKRLLTNSF